MRTSRTDTKTDALVSAQWLEDHLDDPQVRIVEVDVSPAAYDEGHIPGAVLWNIYTDLKDAAYQPRPVTEIEQLIRRSGIAEDSMVVFYGYAPALGLWMMELFGHAEVRILDTARETWQADGRPWTATTAAPGATGYHVPAEEASIRASQSSVKRSIGSEQHTIVDVRNESEYLGEHFWPSGGIPDGGRAGRIPSAVHIPADGLTAEDGSFLAATELERMFSTLEAHHGRQLITYCTVGARAATVWFVLSHILGYENVQVYDGSWAQWGMSPSTPVEQS